MTASPLMDEHAQGSTAQIGTLKRRGLIAGAAALVAGLIAHEQPAQAATTLVNAVNYDPCPFSVCTGVFSLWRQVM